MKVVKATGAKGGRKVKLRRKEQKEYKNVRDG